MLNDNSKILKILNELKPKLSQRYGGSGPFTKAQIDTTFETEKINRKYLTYAYLTFCDEQTIEGENIPKQDLEKLNNIIGVAAGSGSIVSVPIDSIIGTGESGGGIGDIGGGGGE